MNEEDDTFVACHTVKDMPLPPLASHKDLCVKCGIEVWRAFSSDDNYKTICLGCVPEDATRLPPSKKQIKDILDYQQQGRN